MTSFRNMNINVRKLESTRLLEYDAVRKNKKGTWDQVDFSVEDLVSGSGSIINETHLKVVNTNPCWKELYLAQRKESEEQNYCDVRLFTDTEEGYIAAHSLMLLGKSPFLDEAIKDNYQTCIPSPKNQYIGITLTDVSLDHLKAVVTILYSGKCLIDPKDENAIMSILDMLKIDGVETDKSVKKKKPRWVKITRKEDDNTEIGNGVNTDGPSVPSAAGGVGSDVHAAGGIENDVHAAGAEVPGGDASTKQRLELQTSETESENIQQEEFYKNVPYVQKIQSTFVKKPTERIRRDLSNHTERPLPPQPGPSSRAYEARTPNQIENRAEPNDPFRDPLPEIRKVNPQLKLPRRPRIQRRLPSPSPPNTPTSRNRDNVEDEEEEDDSQSKSNGRRIRSRYEEDNDYIPSPSRVIEEEELEALDIEEEEEESDISRPTSRSTRSRSSSVDGARKRYPKRRRLAKGSYMKMLRAAEEEDTRVVKSKETKAKEKGMPPVETRRCLRARKKQQTPGTTSDAFGATDKDSTQPHKCPSCSKEFLELDEFEFHLTTTNCTKSISEMYKLRSNFCGICQVSFKDMNPTEFMQHVWNCAHSGRKLSKRGKQLTEGSIKTNRISKGAAAAAAAAVSTSTEPVMPQSESQESPAHVEASSSRAEPGNSLSMQLLVAATIPETRVYVERLELDRIPTFVMKYRANNTVSRPPLSEQYTYFFKLRDENEFETNQETLQGQPSPAQLETASTAPTVEFAVPLPPEQPTQLAASEVGSSIPASHAGEANVSAFLSSQISTTFDPQFASTPQAPQQPTGKPKRGRAGYRPGPKSRTKRQKMTKDADLGPASVAENRDTLDQPKTTSDSATVTPSATTITTETAPPPPRSKLDIINTAMKLRKSLKERGRKDSCENTETHTIATEKKGSQEQNTASVGVEQREMTAVTEIIRTIMMGNETPTSTVESSSANVQPPQPVVAQTGGQDIDSIEREMLEMFEDSDQTVSGQSEPVEHSSTTTTTHQATPMPSFNNPSPTNTDILLQSLTAADVEDRMTPRTYARTSAAAQAEGQIFGNTNTISGSSNQTLVGVQTATVSTDPLTSSPSTLSPSPAQSQQGYSSLHQIMVAPLPDNTVTTIQELLATSPGVPRNSPPLASHFGPRPAAQQTQPPRAMSVSASNASTLMPPPQSFPSRGGPAVNRQHYFQQTNRPAPGQSEVINRLVRQNIIPSQQQTIAQPNALIPVTRGQHFPNGNILGSQQQQQHQQQSPFDILRVDGVTRPSRPGTPIVGPQQRHTLIDQRQQIMSAENARLQQQSLQSHFRVNTPVPTNVSLRAPQVQNVNRASPQNVLQQQQQQPQQHSVVYQNPQQLQQMMSYQNQQQQQQIQSPQDQMPLVVQHPTPPPNQVYFQQRQPQQLLSYRPSYRVRVSTPTPSNLVQVQPTQNMASGMQQQQMAYNTMAASTSIAQSQGQVQLSSSGTSTIVSSSTISMLHQQQAMVPSTLTQPTSNVPARVFNSGHGNLHVTSLPQNSRTRTPTPPAQRQSGLVRLPGSQFNPLANRATSPATQQRQQVVSLPKGGAPHPPWQNLTSSIPAPAGVNNAVVTRGENTVRPAMTGGLAQPLIRCDGCGLGFLTQQHLSDHLDTGLC